MRAPTTIPAAVPAALIAWALGLASGSPALAQGNSTDPGDFLNNPHPAMPWVWNGATRVDYGQVVRYIEVPAQQVVLTLAVPLPDGVPSRTERQVQTIPAYYVTETTTGYWYPERWTLRQLNVGVYQWAKLPAEFRRK